MSYIVMECHPGYAILLDEEGRFLKAANLCYEVGQIVYDPVLMKEKPKKQWHRWVNSGLAAVAACFLLLFGFSYYQNYLQPYSSIYLSINPEIQMDLNRQGMVVSLTGTNDDGKELLEGYDGKGKDKVTVADELIDRAIDMGFLSEGGQVSFSIDTPDEVLFEEYGTELRTKVTEHMDGRITITIEIVNIKNEQTDASVESVLPTVPSETEQSKPSVTNPANTNLDVDNDSNDADDDDNNANNAANANNGANNAANVNNDADDDGDDANNDADDDDDGDDNDDDDDDDDGDDDNDSDDD